jgi:AraC-like DNA-binding protein
LEKSDKTGPGPDWYAEVPPPPSLAHAVLSLWETSIPELGEARVRILPNACVDIVLYISDPSHGEGIASGVAPPGRSYVVGSTLRHFMVRSIGWRHVVGASILPAGVEPLLGVPARVIGETVALLGDVIGRRAAELEERVIEGPPKEATRRLGEALERMMAANVMNPLVDRAVQVVRGAGGGRRIEDIAGAVNVSTRKLERQFLEHVGLPPKTFSRLVRFDRAVRAIAFRGVTPWSQFALAHGYTDQAHFINEFREFAGITPAEYEIESGGVG